MVSIFLLYFCSEKIGVFLRLMIFCKRNRKITGMNRNFTPCNDAPDAQTSGVAARFGIAPAFKIRRRTGYATLRIQGFSAESNMQPCKFKDSAQNRICSPATLKIQNSRFKACTEPFDFAQDKLRRSIQDFSSLNPKNPKNPRSDKKQNKNIAY